VVEENSKKLTMGKMNEGYGSPEHSEMVPNREDKW
jgi:hypothetical protein